MEVNLNTAHKYLTKLKAHQNSQKKTQQSNRHNRHLGYMSSEPNTEKFNGVLNCESALLYGGLDSDIKTKILTQVQEYKNSYLEKKAISLDIIKIQQAIHRANVQTGVDEALGLIGWSNAQMADMKECLKELDGSNKSQLNNLENFIEKFQELSKKEKENVTIQTSIHAYTKEELGDIIKQLQKKIAELDEKIMSINATTKVRLELGLKSLEILGLE